MKRKQWIGRMNRFLTIVLLVLLIPVFVTVFYQKMQIEELFFHVQKREDTAEEKEQLVSILAKEISANASLECLKAQCVIARTNLYAAKKSDTDAPDGLTLKEMQQVWGNHFLKMYERLEEAVDVTKGETLTYQNRYIYAAYHAVSAGNTRNMSEWYESADFPYLTSVSCQEDCSADDYLAVLYWSVDEFLTLCQNKFPEAMILDVSDIFIQEKDSTGYVLYVQMGDKEYDGETVRMALGLNSSHFTLTQEEDIVRIVTKGLGHGFGMSQFTAEKMVQEGKDYKEILNYFFPGTRLKCE